MRSTAGAWDSGSGVAQGSPFKPCGFSRSLAPQSDSGPPSVSNSAALDGNKPGNGAGLNPGDLLMGKAAGLKSEPCATREAADLKPRSALPGCAAPARDRTKAGKAAGLRCEPCATPFALCLLPFAI